MNPGLTGVLLGAQTAARKRPFVTIDVRDKNLQWVPLGDFSSAITSGICDARTIGSSALCVFNSSSYVMAIKIACGTASASWNLSMATALATGAYYAAASSYLDVCLSTNGSTADIYYVRKIAESSDYVIYRRQSVDSGDTWGAEEEVVNTGYGGGFGEDGNVIITSPDIGKLYYSYSPYANVMFRNVYGSSWSVTAQNWTKGDNWASYGTDICLGSVTDNSGIDHIFFQGSLNEAKYGTTILHTSYDPSLSLWSDVEYVIPFGVPSNSSYYNYPTFNQGPKINKIGSEYYLFYNSVDLFGESRQLYVKSTDLRDWTGTLQLSANLMGGTASATRVRVNMVQVGDYLYLWNGKVAQSSAWSSNSATLNCSISSDILNYSIVKGQGGGRILIELANSGKYIGPSPSAPGHQALKRGAEVIVKEGWYTSCSGNLSVQEGVYYIDSIEHFTNPNSDTVRINAKDGFKRINEYVPDVVIDYNNPSYLFDNFSMAGGVDPTKWNKTGTPTTVGGSALYLKAGDSIWSNQKYGDAIYEIKFSKANTTSVVNLVMCYVDSDNKRYISWQSDNNLVNYQMIAGSAAAQGNSSITSPTTMTKVTFFRDSVKHRMYINGNLIGNSTGDYTGTVIDGAVGIECVSGSAWVDYISVAELSRQNSQEDMLRNIARKGDIGYTAINNSEDSFSSLSAWASQAGVWGVYLSTLSGAASGANSAAIVLSSADVFKEAVSTEHANGRINSWIKAGGSEAHVGQIVCATDSANYLLAHFGINTAKISMVSAGTMTDLIVTHLVTPSANTWYDMSTIVHSNWITVELNGKPILSTYLSTPFTGRKVGFYAHQSDGSATIFIKNYRCPQLFLPMEKCMHLAGQDGLSFMEQIASVQNAKAYMRYDGTMSGKILSEDDPVVRTYYNEIYNGGENQYDQRYNHVIVLGAIPTGKKTPIKGQSFDWQNIVDSGNRLKTNLIQRTDLATEKACYNLADEILGQYKRSFENAVIRTWRDVGLELYDNVKIIDTRTSCQTSQYIVWGLQKRFDQRLVQYDSILSLGNPDMFVPSQSIDFSRFDQQDIISVPASADVPKAPPSTPTSPSSGERTYTVVPGDSLWRIAEKFYGDGRKYWTIYNANRDKISNPSLIYPGQVLRIP